MGNPAPVFFADPFLDGQFVRTINKPFVDLGEAFATARRTGAHGADPDRWFEAWFAMADATESPLRASEYYRQAYFFLRGDLEDKRLRQAYERHVSSFAAALPALGHPAEAVRIPYEDTTLAGYLFAPADGRARGTVVLPGGYDSTAEEGYGLSAAAAVDRGYRALVFDGPGQGSALLEQGLTFRPDFENVLTPVVDWLGDAAAAPIVLFGRSFAGYLAPRAATREHRIAALVCDPAQADMGARLPTGLTGKVAGPALSALMTVNRGRAEFFRSRMATHGVATIEEYFAELRRFTMLDAAGEIRCPTLIVECDNDPIGGGGPALYDALRCPKDLVRLTAVQGVDGHCGGLGQRVWADTVYGWLDRLRSEA